MTCIDNTYRTANKNLQRLNEITADYPSNAARLHAEQYMASKKWQR